MISVSKLYSIWKENLSLALVAGKEGIDRSLKAAEMQRPGLSLSGYLGEISPDRILVFGQAEVNFLKTLDADLLRLRLERLLCEKPPAVFIARSYRPHPVLKELCNEHHIPLIQSKLKTMDLMNQLTVILSEVFAPTTSLHGTLVEVFGMGVLIQGDSSVGKSEAALGLIERGHRLVSDDLVKVKRKEGGLLVGKGSELNQHILEIRGIGIINVAHLFGAVSIRESTQIDMVIKLEDWNDHHFYDRVGLEENHHDVLGVPLTYYLLPVKPGRDVVLLLETTVLNHRLKSMGYHSAKEFNTKLLKAIRNRTIEKSHTSSCS